MPRIFDIFSNALGGEKTRRPHTRAHDRAPAFSEREGRDAPERSEEHAPAWRQVMRAPETASEGRCLVLGNPSAPENITIAEILSEGGYDVDLCDDADAVLASLTSPSDRVSWSLFIVDLDFLQGQGGLEDCVDALMELRSGRCDLPLILISFSFARDDYDEARLPITDASVRAPVLGPRILYAARIAKANNRIWQDRCANRDEKTANGPD